MATRIVMEWTVVIANIFQSYPDTTHEPLWNRIEVDRVGMRALLSTDRKVKCLKWNGFPAVEQPKHRHYFWGRGDLPYSLNRLPGILFTQVITIKWLNLGNGTIEYRLINLRVKNQV